MPSFRETYLMRPSVRRTTDGDDCTQVVVMAGPIHLQIERYVATGRADMTTHLWVGPFGLHIWPYRYPMNRAAAKHDGLVVVWDYDPHDRKEADDAR